MPLRSASAGAVQMTFTRGFRTYRGLFFELGENFLMRHVFTKMVHAVDCQPLFRASLKDEYVAHRLSRTFLSAGHPLEALIAFADRFDEGAARCPGLCAGQACSLSDASSRALVVKGDIARGHLDAESVPPSVPLQANGMPTRGSGSKWTNPVSPGTPKAALLLKRLEVSVTLSAARVGGEASRGPENVDRARCRSRRSNGESDGSDRYGNPSGVPDHVVTTVTENSRALKFSTHGFERESW
jgi:hypothetical protein